MSTHTIPLKSPKIIPNTIMSAAIGFFGYGIKNKFETVVVNKLSEFKPLKFYCIFLDNRGYVEISVFENSKVDCT